MASEPTWLADGQTFSYDIDAKHMGVFSTVGGRMNVLPAATTRSFVTIFRHVIGNRLDLGTMFADYETELVGFSVPLLAEEDRFRVRHLALDLRQEGRLMYFAHTDNGRGADIIEVDPAGAHRPRAGTHPRPDAARTDADRGRFGVHQHPGVFGSPGCAGRTGRSRS